MKRRFIGLVVAAVVIAAAGIAIGVAWHAARQSNSDAERSASATAAGASLSVELEQLLALVLAADSVLESVERGDADEFTDLAARFDDPHVLAVAWAPRVTAAERPAFEQAQGPITEPPGTSGGRSPERDVHYPVVLSRSQEAFDADGRDLGAVPGVRSAIEESQARGETVLAPPRGDDPVVLVRYVERTALGRDPVSGAVVVALDPRVLGQTAALSSAVEIRDGETTVIDGSDGGATASSVVTVGGREWSVVFSDGSPSFVVPGLVVGLSLSLALVIVAMALGGAARERRLRVRSDRDAGRADALRELAERTADIDGQPGDQVAKLAAVAARAASSATSAGVVQFSPAGPHELARVGADDLDADAVAALVLQVQKSGREEREPTAAGVTAGAPVLVDAEVWGAIWVTGAPEEMADPAGAAHVLGIGLANRHRRAKLRLQARTDGLTGLANRRSYLEQLRRETALARRRARPLSMAMIDIDHFKAINDEHGHPAGDRTLTELGSRLTAVARASDLVARVGGDEFVWLMPDTGLAEAWHAAERARVAISRRKMPGEVGVVTMSIGVAAIADGVSADELYANADAALYAAKTSGRDLVAVHEEGVSAETASAGPEAEGSAGRARQRERASEVAREIAADLGWDQARVVEVASAAAEDSPGTSWVDARTARWDGGPLGAHPRGEEIPEEARVLAVADAWAALVGEGGDQPAVRAQAVAALRAASGTAFWPEAVDAIARVVAQAPARAG